MDQKVMNVDIMDFEFIIIKPFISIIYLKHLLLSIIIETKISFDRPRTVSLGFTRSGLWDDSVKLK
jgi:hypothetical protein